MRPITFFLSLLIECAGIHGNVMSEATNGPAVTEAYPTKPVRLIEPFGVGGGPDLLARALAQQLSQLWGQAVTVENIPGSSPDGYTLLVNTSAQAYSAAFSKDLPYNPLKDFIPIAALTSQPYVLITGKATGITTVGELIAAAKSTPGQLKFGSRGVGTGTHLGAEKFNLAAGIKTVHVPAGRNDAIADVVARTIAGDTTCMFAPIEVTLPHIREGRLRALGVSSARRSSLLPDVPTIAEAGVGGFNFPIWYGVWAPTGTPAGVVDKLVKDIGYVLAGRDLRDWLAKHGGEPMNMTRAEFARFVLSESETAAQIISAAGIKSQ